MRRKPATEESVPWNVQGALVANNVDEAAHEGHRVRIERPFLRHGINGGSDGKRSLGALKRLFAHISSLRFAVRHAQAQPPSHAAVSAALAGTLPVARSWKRPDRALIAAHQGDHVG